MSEKRTSMIVDRSRWQDHRLTETDLGDLKDGEVRMRIDRFALTSNNITYAVAGDLLDYWGFFPTGEDGWGHIPVMGFADVVASRNDAIAEGTRVFGFFPMSTHLQVPVGKAGPAGFVDASPHRAQHAPAYVQFSNTATAPMYDPNLEDQYALLRGMFATSFLADDFLADQEFSGAASVLVTSASSKTAISLAFQLAKRPGIRSVGLTSQRNAAFVESLGFYDQVATYEEIESLDAAAPAAVVDMAGNGDVNARIHRHFGDNLVYDCTIGATHWDKSAAAPTDLPGAAPEFFFAPAQIQKRTRDWGADVLQRRIETDYLAFIDSTRSWLEVVHGFGPAAVVSAYEEILAGRAQPHQGHVLSMWA